MKFSFMIALLTSCSFFTNHPKLEADLLEETVKVVEDVIKDR